MAQCLRVWFSDQIIAGLQPRKGQVVLSVAFPLLRKLQSCEVNLVSQHTPLSGQQTTSQKGLNCYGA